jgi:hypothetical protein
MQARVNAGQQLGDGPGPKLYTATGSFLEISGWDLGAAAPLKILHK